MSFIRVQSHECYGFSNHWQLYCLLTSFFRLTTTRTSSLWRYHPPPPLDYPPYYPPVHIGSQVKTRQSQRYTFREFAKTSNFLILIKTFTSDTPSEVEHAWWHQAITWNNVDHIILPSWKMLYVSISLRGWSPYDSSRALFLHCQSGGIYSPNWHRSPPGWHGARPSTNTHSIPTQSNLQAGRRPNTDAQYTEWYIRSLNSIIHQHFNNMLGHLTQ